MLPWSSLMSARTMHADRDGAWAARLLVPRYTYWASWMIAEKVEYRPASVGVVSVRPSHPAGSSGASWVCRPPGDPRTVRVVAPVRQMTGKNDPEYWPVPDELRGVTEVW